MLGPRELAAFAGGGLRGPLPRAATGDTMGRGLGRLMDRDWLRIIDANLNRAREALRVIEDYARFARDDPVAAEAAKRLRHRLRTLGDAIGPDLLLAARDAGGDVGRETKTATELTREGALDVVRAAFARGGEALRTIAEFAKSDAPPAAADAERVRYELYALESCVLARGSLRSRFAAVRLYVIITAELCRTDWRATAAAAMDGGATCLQLREKCLDDRDLLQRARALRALTAERGILFVVNDRPDVARLVDADGVHLGQSDLPVEEARRIVGGDRLIGLSTHSIEQVGAALESGADYLAVGPMFATRTKPQSRVPGLDLLAAARRMTALPLVAIGGITPDDAASVYGAGASMCCVCSAVVAAEDAAAAARAILSVARPR